MSETIELVAGVPYDLGPGNQLMLRETVYPVTVKYYSSNVAGGKGREISSERAVNVEAGYKGRPPRSPILGPDGLPPVAFDNVSVTSDTDQTIKVYVTAGEVDDDRTTGTVQVTDGAMQRVLAGKSFTSYSALNALAANYNHHQVWNDSATENIVITAIRLSAGAAAAFTLAFNGAQISTVYGSGVGRSKLTAGATDGDSEARTEQDTSLIVTSGINYGYSVSASETKVIYEQGKGDPFVLQPGKGLLAQCATINVSTSVSFDYFRVSA